MEVFSGRCARFTVPFKIDSENWFCSNGWRYCARLPVTKGVSFACEKCLMLRAIRVLNNSVGEGTECHLDISPSESSMGTSTQSRPVLTSPFAYFCPLTTRRLPIPTTRIDSTRTRVLTTNDVALFVVVLHVSVVRPRSAPTRGTTPKERTWWIGGRTNERWEPVDGRSDDDDGKHVIYRCGAVRDSI